MQKNLPPRKFFSLLCAVASFFVLGNSAAQQISQSRAGTIIQNQASTTYVNPNGKSSVVTSNIVRTIVAPVYGLSVLPDANNNAQAATNFLLPADPTNDRRAVPGSTIDFAYQIENTGNTTEQVILNVLQNTNDDVDFFAPTFYLDLNNNGVLDAGEPNLGATSTQTLTPGARIGVVVVAQILSPAATGAKAQLDLRGQVLEDPSVVDNNNISNAVVVNDASLSLSKLAAGPNNNLINYTLSGANVGNHVAKSKPGAVILDGLLLDGILIEDAIPTGTFLANSPAVGSASNVYGQVQVIYQVGTDWTSTPNATATKIGLLIQDASPTTLDAGDALGLGGSYSLKFSVQLAASAIGGGEIKNTASVVYVADSGEAVTPSNQTRSAIPFFRGVLVGPYNQASGTASGAYNFTDPITNTIWNITRNGDAANQSDYQIISESNGFSNISFTNTVLNTGNVQDSFALSVDSSNPLTQLLGASLQFFETDGSTPLSGAFTLAPGEHKDFVVRLVLPVGAGSASGITAVIVARSVTDTNTKDSTRDAIGLVAQIMPWLGPIGNPEATEYPDINDQQHQTGQVNTSLIFKHSLKNGGTLPDALGLDVESIPAGWTYRWLDANNQALTDTNNDGLPDAGTLQPGQTVEVHLEISAKPGLTGTDPNWKIVARAHSALQPSLVNRSLDVVDELTAPTITWKLQKSVSPTKQQKPGDNVHYEIVAENVSGFVQTNAVIEDVLNQWITNPTNISTTSVGSNVGTLAISGAYDTNTRTIKWSLPNVPVAAKFVVAFDATISGQTPDASTLPNVATAKSETFVNTQISNTVETIVLGSVISLEKRALNESVAVGGRLGFELIVGTSAKTITLNDVVVEDFLPLGLQYIKGTSNLGGTIFADPTITQENSRQKLKWNLPALSPGQSLRLKFETIGTTLLVPGKIINQATASATTANGIFTTTSNTATASSTVRDKLFNPNLSIIGRVYLDKDDDLNYTPENDSALAGARVYLSNGQYAITDSEGRYSFSGLIPGSYAVRLDPITAPFAAKPLPADFGLRGTRLVRGQIGIEQADFPLFAPNSAVHQSRKTWLSTGPIQLQKTMERAGSGWVVTIHLTVAEKVNKLQLFDAMPIEQLQRNTAELMQGTNTSTLIFNENTLLLGDLAAGDYVLRYAMLDRAPTDASNNNASNNQGIISTNNQSDEEIFAQFTDPSVSWEVAP